MNGDPKLHAAYQKHDTQHQLTESKAGCLIALVLVLSGISLDYLIYPDFLLHFTSLRLLFDVFIVLIYALHFTSVGKKNIKTLSFIWIALIQILMCYMIFLSEGYDSPYFAGVNLIIMAANILLRTALKESFLFCVLSVGLYLLACENNQASTAEFETIYSNIYFIVVTSILSIASVYVNVKRRLLLFRLNHELDNINKSLKEIDQKKSRFFANVSHELRTPLTLILSPIQDLLHKQNISNEVNNTLSMVKDNALRLLKLVNDLLEIVRLEEGKTQLNKVPIILNNLLDGLIDSVDHLAHSKNINITKQLTNENIIILADHRALEKAFLNLLVNAIKFTDSGGNIIVNSFTDSRKKTAHVEVKDTGIGMSASELPYIFDRFRQIDGSATRTQQGTGLGLALVKEITEYLDGQIEVISSPDNGTTMHISFPLCADKTLNIIDTYTQYIGNNFLTDPLDRIFKSAELTGVKNLASDDSSTQFIPDNTDKPLLLIIDDEPDMQRYLISILRTDYQLLYASNGSQGLALFAKHRPDLVLLDLMLPEIDGLEVCSRIKQHKSEAHTKVILLTARADEKTKIEALKRGSDDFLTKPFSSLEIKTRLNNLYQTAQLQRDLQQQNMQLQKALDELKHTQSQLIQSEKINALGNLSAGLLHEINNPLNYTLTALQVAMNDPVILQDEGLLDICEDMYEGMQRISNIASDLRVFAHPSDVTMHAPFLFSSILEKALRFSSLEKNGLNIKHHDCQNVWAMGSEAHITQVLINLISNASNAIHNAKQENIININISCHQELQRIFVSISDNGIGIKKELLSQIFDPFFTTQDIGTGMGLGLSICHTIVKSHGGKLIVDSEENEGTTVTFDIGLARLQ